jgi:predicted MFS family arabinose efflux permease
MKPSDPPSVHALADDHTVSAPEREAVLRVMSAAAFLVFFQAYLVAPLIPSLSVEFGTTARVLGWLVPAYMLPYGLSTLVYGPFSDRAGRRPVLLAMLAAMVLATAGTASARSPGQMLAWRVAAGLASGGIIPISLALFGDLFPYAQRGRALGWIFGAIAGGMAFGSTLGAILNPIIGWRWEFVGVSALTAVVLAVAVVHRKPLGGRRAAHPPGVRTLVRDYLGLLATPRGRRGYAYIFLNSVFHSGVYSWLGLYFARRYHLGDTGIGLALLGYGIPGLLLGPAIGHAADRIGRNVIIPTGILLAAAVAASMAPDVPLAWAAVAVTVLSLGYDMSHPLLAGIITSLDPARRGQAMGLNAFVLFTGFGLGSLVFQWLLPWGLGGVLAAFAAGQLLVALLGYALFRHETAAAAGAQH